MVFCFSLCARETHSREKKIRRSVVRTTSEKMTHLSPETILNGLKQLSTDPRLDPKEHFDFLKEREAQLSKDLRAFVNLWVSYDAQTDFEKRPEVEKKLLEGREETRTQLKKVQNQIHKQIEKVMRQLGFAPRFPGSSTYLKENFRVKVRYQEGEIQIEP